MLVGYVVAGCVACAAGGSGTAALPSEEALRQMADSVNQAYVQAFNSGNADALMAVYFKTGDIVSVGLDGSILTGYDALATDWTKSLDDVPGSTLALTEAHHNVIGPAVLSFGRWTLTPKDGDQSSVLSGPFTILKAYRNGRMAIVMDHVSSDPAVDTE
jgi:ketosteroid isomerase-like protein